MPQGCAFVCALCIIETFSGVSCQVTMKWSYCNFSLPNTKERTHYSIYINLVCIVS
jgi:hypothetical protein